MGTYRGADGRRRRVAGARPVRWVSAGVAAAAVLVTGLVGAPGALASVGTVYTGGTGYLASGRWFRYVQAEVTLPTNAECLQLAPVVATDQIGQNYFALNVELGAENGGNDLGSGITILDAPSTVPSQGCEVYTVSATSYGAQSAMDIEPSAGDTVLMAVYYNPATNAMSYRFTDLTTGQTVENNGTNAQHVVFDSAEAWASFGAFNQPATGFRAFAFTNAAATTATGDRGTMIGPWTTSQVVLGKKGQAPGADCPVLWDGGANFSAWILAKP
jgi:hypothetical protein